MAILVPWARGADRGPVPTLELPLSALGYPGYAAALTRADGYSMETLHVLDSTHLLLTYSLRSLVPRLPGEDGTHSDRLVAAEIVELPTGKVLTRTQWRLHDHAHYLWRAGQDVFVLRSGDSLSTFAPMHGLGTGTSFERVSLPHRPGFPLYVANSADERILTLEMERPDASRAQGDGATAAERHTTIEFYRLLSSSRPEDPIQLKPAGAVGAHQFLRLALDGDGYLWSEENGRNMYQVSFNEFEGQPHDLVKIHSFCTPRFSLLSRAEFLAQTCNMDGSSVLAVYGFDGHENWEDTLNEGLKPPLLVTAPAAGRFALSQVEANGDAGGPGGLSEGVDPLKQEIRVYQSGSGDQLLRLNCATPVREGENFDLSPDGHVLAVLGTSAIELYSLPALTSADRKDLADVQLMAPPLSLGEVNLRRIVRPIETKEAVSGGIEEEGAAQPATGRRLLPTATRAEAVKKPEPPMPSPAPAAKAEPVAATAPAPVAGDAAITPRKPPTLLAPGEAAEYKGGTAAPQ